MPRKYESYPSVPVMILRDASTRRTVGVSGMWMTTFAEAEDHGTIITFLDGSTVHVEQSVSDIGEAFRR